MFNQFNLLQIVRALKYYVPQIFCNIDAINNKRNKGSLIRMKNTLRDGACSTENIY